MFGNENYLEVMAESIRAQSQPSSYDLFSSQEETYQLPEGVESRVMLAARQRTNGIEVLGGFFKPYPAVITTRESELFIPKNNVGDAEIHYFHHVKGVISQFAAVFHRDYCCVFINRRLVARYKPGEGEKIKPDALSSVLRKIDPQNASFAGQTKSQILEDFTFRLNEKLLELFAASRLQPAKFTVSGNEGQLEIANIRVLMQRSTREEHLQRGQIGYGEGPRNMGTSLYTKDCIRSLIEGALGIAARKNSNAIYEQIYKWLIDCKATGQDVFVFD